MILPLYFTQACEQREVHVGGQTKEGVITMVMQVFVDAYTHIPEHRRLMLFTRLVEIVDGNNFLWRCVLLKMTHEISQSAGETTDVRLYCKTRCKIHLLHFIVRIQISISLY